MNAPPPDSWLEIARTAYYERRPGLSITKVAALLKTHCEAAYTRGLSKGGWAGKASNEDERARWTAIAEDACNASAVARRERDEAVALLRDLVPIAKAARDMAAFLVPGAGPAPGVMETTVWLYCDAVLGAARDMNAVDGLARARALLALVGTATTRQQCGLCGSFLPDDRSGETFDCPKCGATSETGTLSPTEDGK